MDNSKQPGGQNQVDQMMPEKVGTIKQIFHFNVIAKDLYTRPREINLMPLTYFKFML
jgi:hypothetical protein